MVVNSNYQKEVSKKLKRYYIIALLSVALFSIVGQLVVQYAISKQRSEATVINLAGRQRMLSQRICKNIMLISLENIFMKDSQLVYKNDLIEVIPKWEKVHYGLMNKKLESNGDIIKLRDSKVVSEMFREIHPIFLIMLRSAKEIRNYQNNFTEYTLIKKTNDVLKNERKFLALMDKIVFQYDLEAKEQIKELKNLELILFFLTIIILIIEGVFVFKPLHKQVSQTIVDLIGSEKHLSDLNQKLFLTNESLLVTKNDLNKATEEKFKLELQKGKVRSASLLEGQEEERKRLAFELHDGLGQMLTGLKLISERISVDTFENEKDINTLKELKLLINETISETRTISFNLAPSVLNDFGVYAAIRILLENNSKNFEYKIDFDNSTKRFSSNIEMSLYRITQEAINNFQKHSNASLIEINLKSDPSFVYLTISDNGIGFDLKKNKNKLFKNGIRNMQSRTEVNQGVFKMQSAVGMGTTISVKLPIKNQTHNN